MKILIVTTVPPPIVGVDVHGVYKRLGVLIRSCAAASSSLRILHLPLDTGLNNIDNELPTFPLFAAWGVEGIGRTVPVRNPPMSLLDVFLSPFSIRRRPKFRPYCTLRARSAFETELADSPDLILVHRLTSSVVLRNWQRISSSVLFDIDDIEHRVKIRLGKQSNSLLNNLFHLLQVPAIFNAERRMVASASSSFVCSYEDRSYLLGLGFRGSINVVANAVRFPTQFRSSDDGKTIMFIGGYQYGPNAAAAERLVTRIWPLIVREHPQSRLLIAGSSPELIPAFRTSPAGVSFLGFVDDLDALYEGVSLVCCPIEVGGGTRIKLIEAAAYAKPMVSTSIGAEGLSFAEDEEIVIRETDQAIARACSDFLYEPDRAKLVGAAAQRRARNLYETSAIESSVEEMIIRTVAGAPKSQVCSAQVLDEIE